MEDIVWEHVVLLLMIGAVIGIVLTCCFVGSSETDEITRYQFDKYCDELCKLDKKWSDFIRKEREEQRLILEEWKFDVWRKSQETKTLKERLEENENLD